MSQETLHVVCNRQFRLPVDVSAERIERYLRQGHRPIQALLSRDRLQPLGSGRFAYDSRPVQLLEWSVTPQVVFEVQWHDKALHVAFEQCRFEGPPVWEQLNGLLGFGCQARLAGEDNHILGEAVTSLAIQRRGLLRFVPAALIRQLAQQALEATLNRLVQRCERGLRKDLHRWQENVSWS